MSPYRQTQPPNAPGLLVAAQFSKGNVFLTKICHYYSRRHLHMADEGATNLYISIHYAFTMLQVMKSNIESV